MEHSLAPAQRLTYIFPMLKLSAPPIRGLLVVAALCPALSAGARSTEVNVIVDFTPEGRKVAHPNPGNPAYYYPVMGSFEELGAGEAGEKAPKQWDVAHVAALELAKQGYLKMNPTPYVNAAGQVTYRDGTVVMVPANPIPGPVSYTHLDVYKRQTSFGRTPPPRSAASG